MNILVPIWKDYILTAPGDYVDYTVSLGDEIIYRGRAYKRPGDAQVSWSINSIAADYLRPVWPGFPAAMNYPHQDNVQGTGAQRFIVSYNGTSQELTFYNDWSYSEPATAATYDQTVIIFPDYDVRIPLFQCFATPNWAPTPGARYLQRIIRYVRVDGGGTFRDEYVDYRAVHTCYRYVLFFVNAYGGWSFIYLENLKALQDYDRKTAKRTIVNAGPSDREIVDYVNQVTQRWTAKTPYLTDAQAAKMWHVLGTVSAYLYDMDNDVLTAVNVTNGTAEEKTYRNQGAKRVRYDISLTLAQDRLRR